MESGDNTGYLLEHVASIMYRQSDQLLQERLGVGMSQYKLLLVLQYEPGARQSVLARRLGQTEASISRQVKLLCGRGVLAVRVNPANRREHETVITPKGMKLALAANGVLAEYHETLLGRLDDKLRRQLQEILGNIHAKACPPTKPHDCGPPFIQPVPPKA